METTTPELFGDKYHERYCTTRYDWDNQEPCADCGRPVNIRRPHHVIEFGEQGFFAIGPECRRMFPAAVRVEP